MKKLLAICLIGGMIMNSSTIFADDFVTREKFVTEVNSKFGYTKVHNENFVDTDNVQFAIAKEVGYYMGTTQNEALPDEKLTLQDVVTLLSRVYNFKTIKPTALNIVVDKEDIKGYAKKHMASFLVEGIITTDKEHKLNPNATITINEFNEMVLKLDNKFKLINNDSKLGDKNNNLLESLNVPITVGIEAKLEPEFNPNVTEYTLNLTNDSSNIEIIPIAQSYYSKITVNGIPQFEETPFDMMLQQNSVSVQLAQGNNEVVVSVTSSNGESKNYTINVVREDLTHIHNKFLKEYYYDEKTGIEMPYRLFVPEGYDANNGEKYPLVFVLHGSGERGDDNELQLTANLGATVWATDEVQSIEKAFVLAPQARNGGFDTGFGLTRGENGNMFGIDLTNAYKLSEDTKVAKRILDLVTEEYNIDTNRLYSTGVSQGGFGVWALNLEYPELFAAMVPVAGGGNFEHENIDKIVHKPIWVFHAEADFIIPVSEASNIVDALTQRGSNIKFNKYGVEEYFLMAHSSWIPAYNNKEMIEWLFEQ